MIWFAVVFIAGMGNVSSEAIAKTNSPAPIIQADFCLGFVNLGDDFAKIKDGFEPPLAMTDRRLWGADGQYHSTWENTDAVVMVTESSAMFRVQRFEVFSGKYPTLRGVQVGDSADDVIRAYGEPHSKGTRDATTILAYNRQGVPNPYSNNLIFYADANSGEIKSIKFVDAAAE